MAAAAAAERDLPHQNKVIKENMTMAAAAAAVGRSERDTK